MHRDVAPRPRVLRFAPVFSSRMVLQQAPARSALFGDLIVDTSSASPPSNVRVHITVRPVHKGRRETRRPYSVEASLEAPVKRVKRKRFPTYTVPDGLWTWRAYLHPMPAGGDWIIRATANTSETHLHADLHVVTFGDVWMCAGQSNMEHELKRTFGHPKTVKAAASGSLDNIRLLPTVQRDSHLPLEFAEWTTARQAARLTPNYAAKNAYGTWLSPTTLGHAAARRSASTAPRVAASATSGSDWRLSEPALNAFCSVCWYFAVALTERFVAHGRPAPSLGLVCAASGGASSAPGPRS